MHVTSWLTVIAVLVAAPVIGAILMGLDRKVTARVQGRVGPPIIQPIYDIFKLLGKSPIALNKMQLLYAFFHLAFMMLTLVLLALGQDILMVLFAHAFSTIALILGGMSVRSPYSRIGSMRKIMQMVAYEPILIIMVIAMYKSSNSFMASDIFHLNKPLLLTMPLIFVAYLIAVAIKLDKSPFDVATSHHAHQELVKGVTLEYSGPYLAIIELTHFYEAFLLFAIVAMFWATNLWIGLLLEVLAFFALIILDNAFARLTTLWMVRFMWTVPMLLALSNLLWFYI